MMFRSVGCSSVAAPADPTNSANDPANPIGEHWIGLAPDEERIRGLDGYGIHGTIDLDSIGRQASMGCVRMRPDDVELIYGVLMEDISTVVIRE